LKNAAAVPREGAAARSATRRSAVAGAEAQACATETRRLAPQRLLPPTQTRAAERRRVQARVAPLCRRALARARRAQRVGSGGRVRGGARKPA
jgi:hypothetical protein